MRGRSGDRWTAGVAGRSPPELVKALSDAGFSGILIDRYGYADPRAGIESALTAQVGATAWVSDNLRWSFVNLSDYRKGVRPADSPAARQAQRERTLHPLHGEWKAGFYPAEAAERGDFRWCPALGDLEIDNSSASERWAVLRMDIFVGRPPAMVTVTSELGSERLEVTSDEGVAFVRKLRLSPGRHLLRFTSDGKPVDAPNDPRVLIWRVENPALEEVP
jgi:phosphoglycerol transferase